jgi:hypothetical protein
MIKKEIVKKRVEIIRQFFEENICVSCGIATPITQSTAYELISKLAGFESWNSFSAYIKNQEVKK